jgi:hypothetical protein
MCHRPVPAVYGEINAMNNPLDSLWGTIILGLILTLILHLVVKFGLGG